MIDIFKNVCYSNVVFYISRKENPIKKLFSLMLCLALALTLTACGGNESAATEAPAEIATVSLTLLSSEIRNNGEGTDETKLEYVYDEKGVCTEIVSYLNGEEVLRAAPKYDEAGNILEKTYANFGNPVVETYTYDENGKVLTFVQATPEGDVIYQYEDVPHETAEFAKRTMTNFMTLEDGSKMEINQVMECTFDDQNYMIAQDVYMNGQLAQHYEMVNDDQGRLVKQMGYSADGSLMNTMEVTYDGNTRHMVSTDAAGNILNEQYGITDDAGNRLEAKVLMGGKIMNYQAWTYITMEVPAA